jgi:hypothetical protein
MAFEKSMKSFCDGTCRKRFKVIMTSNASVKDKHYNVSS